MLKTGAAYTMVIMNLTRRIEGVEKSLGFDDRGLCACSGSVAFYWEEEPQGPSVCEDCGGQRLQVIFEWVDRGIGGGGSCVG